MQVDKIIFIALLSFVSFGFSEATRAQSTDQALPTPVLSNDIDGKIAALDVGDPRSTRHFYAFAASPGDLLVTVDSKNLNGDIDVFTAITFRPLMKTTVYSSSQSPSVTKGIYLRAHQILVLRVEARTPNDDPGTYHIHFGGTFEAFSGGIPVSENRESTEASTAKTASNRLSSVGATIPKPPAQIAKTAEAKPSPSPDKTDEKAAEVSESSKTEPAKPAPNSTARGTTTRTPRRGTRPAPRRTPPAEKKTDTATNPAPTSTEPKSEPADKPEPAEQPKPDKTTAEKSSETAPVEKPKTQDLSSQPGATRLIIEEKDGTRIERPMSTVRRVIVEGPTIVIVLKTGRIDRIPMADVARMAIEPQ